MAAVLRELRDPMGLGLAALTGAGNWVLGVQPSLAIAAALAVLAVKVAAGLAWPRPAARNSIRPGGASLITRRELEIAELITAGMSNREIARKLFLSERTVDNHVQHLLNKLTFHSRAQIAAWVERQRTASS
jgi:DNA-binding NarL/FixJ family response regulator